MHNRTDEQGSIVKNNHDDFDLTSGVVNATALTVFPAMFVSTDVSIEVSITRRICSAAVKCSNVRDLAKVFVVAGVVSCPAQQLMHNLLLPQIYNLAQCQF